MGYSKLKNELVSAANGVDYAYRDTGGGEGGLPLVLLQHFRGNLNNWDPALIDALATARRVVTFDNAGVGGSTGTTPGTIEQMAHDAIAFLAAMGFSQVDLLGFSIGSFVAQQITLVRPDMVRRLILASSAPQGAAGMHGWAPEVIGAIGTPHTSPEAYLDVFFTRSAASRQAGTQAQRRIYARTEDRDTATTWATREAQYDAVCTWGIPDHTRLQRLIAQDTGPGWAPHSWLAGTLSGLPLRCCMMIGVNGRSAGLPRMVIAKGWTKSVSDPLTIGKYGG